VPARTDGRIAVVDRRTFLVMGVAALGLAGCTTDTPEPPAPTGPSTPAGPDDPDAGLRATVARSEAELILAYRAAISTRPELASDLQPFLDHHEQHLERVVPGADPQALVTPSAGASQSPLGAAGSAADPGSTAPLEPSTSASLPGAADLPGRPSGATDSGESGTGSEPLPSAPAASATEQDGAAIAALADAERVAHVARVSACDGASTAGLARDLCLIAASEAQHAAVLDSLAEEVAE
jgi:hypothetical protein